MKTFDSPIKDMAFLSVMKTKAFYLLAVSVITIFLLFYWSSRYELNNFRPKRLLAPARGKLLTKQEKESVLLFIGIVSAPRLVFRRNALRRSWLSRCKSRKDVVCWIFSDAQDTHGQKLPEYMYAPLTQEQYLHGDLVLAESPGGINFARRYLWMIDWANQRYQFDFFLRVDDDYFVCIDRLLLELPHRQEIPKLYWGHVHCYPKGGIRVDEGFVIVTNDLVQEFLKEQNNSLMCHPFGDQAMAIWINNIPGVIYFGDPRVLHDVSAEAKTILNKHYPDLCGSYLALHQSFPLEIERYWTKQLSVPSTKTYAVPRITYPCGDQDKTYNTTNFLYMYHAEPVLCKTLPTWNISESYSGRYWRVNPESYWN